MAATSPTRQPGSPKGAPAAGPLSASPSPRVEVEARAAPSGRQGPTWENTYITKPEEYGEARACAALPCATLARR